VLFNRAELQSPTRVQTTVIGRNYLLLLSRPSPPKGYVDGTQAWNRGNRGASPHPLANVIRKSFTSAVQSSGYDSPEHWYGNKRKEKSISGPLPRPSPPRPMPPSRRTLPLRPPHPLPPQRQIVRKTGGGVPPTVGPQVGPVCWGVASFPCQSPGCCEPVAVAM